MVKQMKGLYLHYRWPTYSEYAPNEMKPWMQPPYLPPPFTAGRSGCINRGIPHFFPKHRFRGRRGNYVRASNPWCRNRIPHSFPYVSNSQCVMIKKDKTADELIQPPTEKNVAYSELTQEFMPVNQKIDKERFSHECQSFINSNAHHCEANTHRYSFTPGQYENEALTVNANNEIQNLHHFEYPHLFQSDSNFYHGWSNYAAGQPVEEYRGTDNFSLPATANYSNQTSMECNFAYNSHYLNSEINYKPNEIMPNDSDSTKMQSKVLENVSSIQNSENFLEKTLEPLKSSTEFLNQQPMDETSLAVLHVERLLASMAPDSNLPIQDLNKTMIPDLSLNPRDSNDSCAQVYILKDLQESAKSVGVEEGKLQTNLSDLSFNFSDSNYCAKIDALKDMQESAKSTTVEEAKLHPNLPIQANSSEAMNKDSNLSSNNYGDSVVNLFSLHDETSNYLSQSTTLADEKNSYPNTYAKINKEEANNQYLNENGNNSSKPDRNGIPEVADILKCDSGLSISLVAPEAYVRDITSANTTDNENNSDSASHALTPEKVKNLLEPLESKKEPHETVKDVMRLNQTIFNALSNGMATNAENMVQMEIQKMLCKNLQTLSESLTKFFATLSLPADSYFFRRNVNLNAEQRVVSSKEMKDDKEKSILQSSRNEGSAGKAVTLQMPTKKNSADAFYGDVLNTNIYPNQVESTLSSVTNYVLEEPTSKEPWKLNSIFNSDFTSNDAPPENEIELCEAEHVYDTRRKRKTKEGDEHKNSEFLNEKSFFLNQSKHIFQGPKSVVSFIEGNVEYLECKARNRKIKVYRDIQTQTEHIDSKGQDMKLQMPCYCCQSHLPDINATGRSNVIHDCNNERNLLKISTGRKRKKQKRHKIKKRRKRLETGHLADINHEHFSSSICTQKTKRNYSLDKRRLTFADSQIVGQKDSIINHKNDRPNDFYRTNLSTLQKGHQIKVCQRKTFTVTTIRRKNVRHSEADGVQETKDRNVNQKYKPTVTQKYVKDSSNLPMEHELAEVRREKEAFLPSSSSPAGNPVSTRQNLPRNNVRVVLSRIDQSSIVDEVLQSKRLCQLPQKLYHDQDKSMARDKHDQKDETTMARDEQDPRGETSTPRLKTLGIKSAYLEENNEICQLPSVSEETKLQIPFKEEINENSVRGPLFTYCLRQTISRRNYSF